jgi:AAA+ ATPase superfamily predicted ATPase
MSNNSPKAFIGREYELNILSELFKKNTASFVVIQGRRRIGKSRSVEEFAKNKKFYRFSGLPPMEHTSAQDQRDEFMNQLAMQTSLPRLMADDWSNIFSLLAEKTSKGRVIILFDEISWMGDKDPNFLGKLKNAWDLHFKSNPQLMLIVCGSASSWIQKNILSNTGFLGRISFTLVMQELPLEDAAQFWNRAGGKISAYEKLKTLSVIGGIPKYLEEINPDLSAEENIKRLCFTRGGSLVEEFQIIFSDLFGHKAKTYQKIIEVLGDGAKDISQICNILNLAQSGFISEYLNDLVVSGFISRDYSWHIKSGKISKLSKFRLSDNYIRFYLKYIKPNHNRIINNDFALRSLTSLPGWDSIIGLQFENIVIKNKHLIKQTLGITQEDVVSDNPFSQSKTTKQRGCQIDYLIQTRFNTLYLCEFKFSQNIISTSIIPEMQEKMDRLIYPKGFSCRPVLVHVNGVSESVVDSGFFSNIIDFSKFLE